MPDPRFHLYLWPQRLLVVAPGFASGLHCHHAAQAALGLEGPAVFETPDGKSHRGELLIIAPDAPHAHPDFGPSALLFLEPESSDWARAPFRIDQGVATMPLSPELRRLARGAASDTEAAQSLIEGLLGDNSVHTPADADALVEDARQLVQQGLGAPISLAGLARRLHRSPSRLAHRFRVATGVPLRRYVLWRRLRAAAEQAMRGASLTEAAHAAGFADSAHLSRTFRAMFGVAPSLLFERPGSVHVHFFS